MTQSVFIENLLNIAGYTGKLEAYSLRNLLWEEIELSFTKTEFLSH